MRPSARPSTQTRRRSRAARPDGLRQISSCQRRASPPVGPPFHAPSRDPHWKTAHQAAGSRDRSAAPAPATSSAACPANTGRPAARAPGRASTARITSAQRRVVLDAIQAGQSSASSPFRSSRHRAAKDAPCSPPPGKPHEHRFDPNSEMLPRVGRINPARVRSSVVFPAPLSPRMA